MLQPGQVEVACTMEAGGSFIYLFSVLYTLRYPQGQLLYWIKFILFHMLNVRASRTGGA